MVVHVAVFGYLAVDNRQDLQKNVVIEFAMPAVAADVPAPVVAAEKVKNTTQIESPVAKQTSKSHGDQKVSDRTTALDAILAMDLSSLRANAIRSELRTDSRAIQTAGFGPIEPLIHLTGGEVDSLVSTGHTYQEEVRKRGVTTGSRGPTVCIPQR